MQLFNLFLDSKDKCKQALKQVIKNCYGNNTAKLVRQFEKLDFKYCKLLLLDLSFLENCVKNSVAPKFVQFCFPIEIYKIHLHNVNVNRNYLNRKLSARKMY